MRTRSSVKKSSRRWPMFGSTNWTPTRLAKWRGINSSRNCLRYCHRRKGLDRQAEGRRQVEPRDQTDRLKEAGAVGRGQGDLLVLGYLPLPTRTRMDR